jgi:NAD(P)-dependent dehydrogenase (short-subunit alcohol dehydrogenase family)
MENIFSVKNKVIIITGAGKGIGSLLADELSKRSAIVYAIDKIFPKNNPKKNYFTKKCNITNKIQLEKICKDIFKNEKKIDVLINNAGITIPNNSLNEYSLEDWKKTLDVNLTGSFLCAQIIGKILKKQRNGSIINMTSINAELGFPNNPGYIASKGGLKMLTKSLAKDLGKYGIRVNNLGPGYFITDMTKNSYKNKKSRISRQNHTLLGRWGNVLDLVGPCIFLASDASAYITGQDLYVDGGWTANGLIE